MGEASYLSLYRSGRLKERAEAAHALLSPCRLCPRQCAADRLSGSLGFCGLGRQARVASAAPHFGEERPLVGVHGSGTIFFSGCNLGCLFCQNDELSHAREGRDTGPEELARTMLALQDRGCHNLNLVTPTHLVPQILEALVIASGLGLSLPLVYNCGGYERVETLRLLEGVIDIYMPDFKFWDDAWAKRLCGVPDYRERTSEALREMHRQVGDLEIDAHGLAVRGLLVRHLVMPGGIAGSADIFRFLARTLSRDTYVNVMDQYHPCGKAWKEPLLARSLYREEYQSALREARDAGLRRLD